MLSEPTDECNTELNRRHCGRCLLPPLVGSHSHASAAPFRLLSPDVNLLVFVFYISCFLYVIMLQMNIEKPLGLGFYNTHGGFEILQRGERVWRM